VVCRVLRLGRLIPEQKHSETFRCPTCWVVSPPVKDMPNTTYDASWPMYQATQDRDFAQGPYRRCFKLR
jgi:hypothetical protein